MKVENCEITVINGPIPEEEIAAYVERARIIFGRLPKAITILIDGEEVELDYDFGPVPFNRIRRITGYLVGDLNRFNNAKRAEERERVKHQR